MFGLHLRLDQGNASAAAGVIQVLGRTATLVGFFFQFDELLSYRLAFDQLDEGDRNANRCLQDAEHQAC
ncbi:MAG: hypothetical protein ACK5OC_25010, partial [Pirellula sp.]